MNVKQTYPFFLILEYDKINTPVDPDWLTAFVMNVKHTLINCTDRNVFVLENKVPKRLLAKGAYHDTYGLLKYNRDVGNPYYELRPRPGSFEVTLRDEVIWSRRRSGKYPAVDYLRHRLEYIVACETNEDFMRLAQARNIFQFIEKVQIPEEKIMLKDMVDPVLYQEYKRLQMKHQLQNYLKNKVKSKRDEMRRDQKEQMLRSIAKWFKSQIMQKQQHFEFVQYQKTVMLSIIAASLKSRIANEVMLIKQRELRRLKMLNQLAYGLQNRINMSLEEKRKLAIQKELMLKSIREKLQIKINAEIMRRNKIKCEKEQILAKLREHFRKEVDEATKIVEFNEQNDPQKKYAGQTMEQMAKKMTVKEMILAQGVPPEILMQKLKQIKVTYLGPSTDLSQPKNEDARVARIKAPRLTSSTKVGNSKLVGPNKKQQKIGSQSNCDIEILVDDGNDKSELQKDSKKTGSVKLCSRLSTDNLKTPAQNLDSGSISKTAASRQQLLASGGKSTSILGSEQDIDLSDAHINSQLSLQTPAPQNQKSSEMAQKFKAALKAAVLGKLKQFEFNDHDMNEAEKDEQQESDQEEEEGVTDQKEYFDMFNALTQHHWKFKLPTSELIELDDTECVLVNQQRNLIIIEYLKLKVMRFKVKECLRYDGLPQWHQQLFDVTAQLHGTVNRYRYTSPNPQATIDLLSKKLFYEDQNTRREQTVNYDADLNDQKSSNKHQNFTDNIPSLDYKFQHWGWLGNEYLKQNDFRMPSWTQVQGCIIQEQIIKHKEEELKKRSRQGKLQRLEVDSEIIHLMAVKIQLWQDIFSHLDLPEEVDLPIPDREFKNPKSKTIKSIFYLYSLDSFLYGRLNWAARSRKASCIKTLGCMAAILSKALSEAGRFREDHLEHLDKKIVVYRGLGLTNNQIMAYKENQLINMSGYTSVSKNFKESLRFACHPDMDPSLRSVMFYIELPEGTEGGFSFQMNDSCYTKFPEEEEILLDDGRPFIVDSVIRDCRAKVDGYRGKTFTRITFKSSLPRGIQVGISGRLSCRCTLQEFLQNDHKDIVDNQTHWLCFFQAQHRDLAGPQAFPLSRSSTVTSTFRARRGYKAAASLNEKDADALYFEKYARIPGREDTESSQFLGVNSFRIYTNRLRPDSEATRDREPIRRYLSLDPSQNKRSASFSLEEDEMYASFEPDEYRASVWQFELLKSSSHRAKYIIVNRVWMWDRLDNQSKEGWISFENCSYLAFQPVDTVSKTTFAKRNNVSGYVYVTRDRNQAAVWTWEPFPEDGEAKIEINLPKEIYEVSLFDWVCKSSIIPFTTKNVSTFPMISFNNYNNSFVYTQHYRNTSMKSALLDALNSAYKIQPKTVFERHCGGTWSIFKIHQASFIELIFSDENIANKQKGKVVLQIDVNDRSFLTCRQSTSHRIIPPRQGIFFNLIRCSDPDYLEKFALSHCQILKDEAGRQRLLDLLPDGVRLSKYILCCQANKERDRTAKSKTDFVTEFQDACVGKATLIVVRGEHNRIFGAYTEISWTKNVSAPKESSKEMNPSFIFAEDVPNFQTKRRKSINHMQNRFNKYQVLRGQNETFHSDEFGANFYDLRFRGPDERSDMTVGGNHYDLPSFVASDRPHDKESRLKYFKYKIMEVFSLSTTGKTVNQRWQDIPGQILQPRRTQYDRIFPGSSYLQKSLGRLDQMYDRSIKRPQNQPISSHDEQALD